MGDTIRASPLIVIGDISTLGAPKFESVVVVREVVRGDAHPGDRITLPRDMSTRDTVPQAAQNVAVLFAPDWKKNPFGIKEVYQKPEELAALRVLIAIYKLPGERAQLLALQTQAGQANPILATQLIADFGRMREAQNFDIVLSSFHKLDVAHQGTLIQLLERIGDERSLPLLIAGLKSPERTVRYYAQHALTFGFPGAPGVTEAFRLATRDPATRDEALYYLRKHDPDFAATFPPLVPTLWMQAQAKLENGDKAAAQEALFAVIEQEKEANWASLDAARTLLPLLDEDGKTRLRGLLTGMLMRETSSYSDAQSGVALLQALPDQSNIPALLHLLYDPKEAPYSAWDGATRATTFALVDLGPAAKQKALAKVLARMKTRLVPGVQLHFNEEALYFCQLAWLADDTTWQSVMAQLPTGLAAQMKALQPLRDAAVSRNESVTLAALLPDTQNRWQGDSNRWIIARLGELRDPVAVAPLFGELERSLFSGSSGDIETALIHIGGPTVEAGAVALLRREPDELRRSGMDILRALQGEKMRPLLRRMLTEKGLGNQRHALFLLGYVGTPDDLPLLLPLADFWKGDRALQGSAATAIAEIRDRCGHDVNGPIHKTQTI